MILLRKISSFLIVMAIVFSLVSCNKNSDNTQTSATQTTETTQEQSTTAAEEEDNSSTLAAFLRTDFPVTDGSTSTNPLDTAIRKAILGEDAEEAWHTTTHMSFDRLLEGKCDLILTVKISEDQAQKAKKQGIGIEQYPISKEAFVVVLNKDNPVKSITQQQLKDIYSGKITNWKSLGGPDAQIIAYQRNGDTGS